VRGQRDVAVGVHLPHRGAQPKRGPDLHHRIDGQAAELSLAHSGAGHYLDRDTVEPLGQSTGREVRVQDSLCQIVIATGVAPVVTDTHGDVRVQGLGAVTGPGIIGACLDYPVLDGAS
jgi:hypothetical protein